jgi:hypothetical protein
MTRLENLPGPVALKRMMAAMLALFCDRFDQAPRRLVLDIDDTEDRTYGGQQLSRFTAHHDSYGFMPIHIYEATTGKPVAVFRRPGKTPTGAEIAGVLRHVVKALRARWPAVEIIVRGDSHYGRHELMEWCERRQVGYIFGLAGNAVLTRLVQGDVTRTLREWDALPELDTVRRYGEFRYAAKSWTVERRVIARGEASDLGVDTRFIVSTLKGLEHLLYEKFYCARGQAEHLIKAHKLHLASDRTSCTRATANQFRRLVHTAAYWLIYTLRSLVAKPSCWGEAQFDSLRLGLIKIAARVTERATRIIVSLPSLCAEPETRRTRNLDQTRWQPCQVASLSPGAACPTRNPFRPSTNQMMSAFVGATESRN